MSNDTETQFEHSCVTRGARQAAENGPLLAELNCEVDDCHISRCASVLLVTSSKSLPFDIVLHKLFGLLRRRREERQQIAFKAIAALDSVAAMELAAGQLRTPEHDKREIRDSVQVYTRCLRDQLTEVLRYIGVKIRGEGAAFDAAQDRIVGLRDVTGQHAHGTVLRVVSTGFVDAGGHVLRRRHVVVGIEYGAATVPHVIPGLG